MKKQGQWILTAVLVTAFLSYTLFSLGRSNGVLWTFTILGFLIGSFILGQAGFVRYVKGKEWKPFTFEDIALIGSFVIGFGIILNSLIFIPVLRNVSPEWLVSYLAVQGAILGAVGGILSIILLWMKK